MPRAESEAEAEGDDGAETATAPQDASGWLEGINELERQAVAEEPTTSDACLEAECQVYRHQTCSMSSTRHVYSTTVVSRLGCG